MALAREPVIVLDCPDPLALARFYGALLDWPVEEPTGEGGEWVNLRPAGSSTGFAFQRVESFRAPDWPGQDHPQQMHVDVHVDDLDAGERAVLELGAIRHEHQPGSDFRVYLDPAGHPFCLCQV